MRQAAKRLFALTAMVMVGVVALGTSPASAANGTISASSPGVYSEAYITFTGNYSINVTKWKIQDTACDSADVFAEIRDQSNIVLKRYNSNGCGTTVTLDNLTGSRNALNGYLTSIRMRVCKDDTFTNECNTGSSLDNPHN